MATFMPSNCGYVKTKNSSQTSFIPLNHRKPLQKLEVKTPQNHSMIARTKLFKMRNKTVKIKKNNQMFKKYSISLHKCGQNTAAKLFLAKL